MSTVARAPARGQARARRATLEVYYDGECAVCRAFRRGVEALDWLGLVHFCSISDPAAARRSGIAAADLAARLHVRWPATGRTASGLGAVAAVAARLPATTVLAPPLWLAARTRMGQSLYDTLARRRYALSGACGVSCRRAGRPGSNPRERRATGT